MLDLLRGLHGRGCRVVLVCRELPAEIGCREIPFRVVTWQQVGRHLSVFRHEEMFREIFQQPAAQVIHVYGTRLGPAGRRLLKVLTTPAVFTPISTSHDMAEATRIQRRCGGVIALGQSMREALVNRLRIPREKVSVVSPGVDLSACPEAPPRADGRVPVVGTAGPLEPGRGQQLFLEAARRILDSGRQAEFVVAGDGPAEKKLRRYAADLGLNKRLAFVTRLAAYGDVISTVDVFVRAAPTATIGTTVLEAMGCSKPVVACATAGIVEIVEDGVSGCLVPKKDVTALTAAIGRLLDDPALAQRIGAAARRRVAERFNMEAVVEKTLRVYADVVKAEGR